MEKFEVFRKDLDSVAVLNIQGFLDAHTAPEFETELQKIIGEKKFNIIVNLDGLQYISSAGLGVFMGVIEDIRKNGGDLKICCAAPKVYKVFDLLGFPSLYEFYDTEEAAVKKFNKKTK
ncbi:MAG: STAS domain-containing protein [Calditrichaeota bacterium]|nr:STAS domain-containing protein [Calditrichota bacterium]